VLDRMSKVRPDSQRRWGSISAHQMICHLSDSFRVALGEKHVCSSSTLLLVLHSHRSAGRFCHPAVFGKKVNFAWSSWGERLRRTPVHSDSL
jgi:hypothetical protein